MEPEGWDRRSWTGETGWYQRDGTEGAGQERQGGTRGTGQNELHRRDRVGPESDWKGDRRKDYYKYCRRHRADEAYKRREDETLWTRQDGRDNRNATFKKM